MTETAESDAPPAAEDENEASVTDLLEQLGREVSALVLYESRLAVSRHKPEIRRTAGDVAAALAVALALLTAFVLANAAVVRALSTSMPDWVAPLVLAAVWIAVGALLALYLLGRARRHPAWKLEDAEKARAEAEQAVRKTLEQLGPAISKEIALAAVPVATDMAEGVVEAGEEIIESADEIVDAITEEVPGGGVVNQMWDVVLMPGRLGIRVATTVLRRGEPAG